MRLSLPLSCLLVLALAVHCGADRRTRGGGGGGGGSDPGDGDGGDGGHGAEGEGEAGQEGEGEVGQEGEGEVGQEGEGEVGQEGEGEVGQEGEGEEGEGEGEEGEGEGEEGEGEEGEGEEGEGEEGEGEEGEGEGPPDECDDFCRLVARRCPDSELAANCREQCEGLMGAPGLVECIVAVLEEGICDEEEIVDICIDGGPGEGEGEPPRDCEDPDPLEPNNSSDNASPVRGRLSREDLGICPRGDEDWFRIPAGRGDVIVVNVRFNHADGDLDIMLYRRQVEVVNSAGVDDSERIDLVADGADDYHLQIYGYEGATNPYLVSIEINGAE